MAQPCLHLRQSFAGTPLSAPQIAQSSACPLRRPTRMAQSLQVSQQAKMRLLRSHTYESRLQEQALHSLLCCSAMEPEVHPMQ